MSYSAGSVRQRIADQTGDAELAERLVPRQPNEAELRARAALLQAVLEQRLAAAAPAVRVGDGQTGRQTDARARSRPPGALALWAASRPQTERCACAGGGGATELFLPMAALQRRCGGTLWLDALVAQGLAGWGGFLRLRFFQVQGSGPWGLPLPNEVPRMMEALRSAAEKVVPRLQQLLEKPGADQVQY
jgi:hypothetical protein